MAQTTYVEAMKTIAEVDTAVMCAINHIILTQLGMKKRDKDFWRSRSSFNLQRDEAVP